MKDLPKTYYDKVAKRINNILKDFNGMGLEPKVEVIKRGNDGLLILLNDDCYDLAEHKGEIQDIFYSGEVFVIGDYDLYLEPFDSYMVFKLAN